MFEVGQRVVVNNFHDVDFVGEKGVIIGRCDCNGVLIEFDRSFSSHLHNGNKIIKNNEGEYIYGKHNHCYYISNDDVELIGNNIEIDTRLIEILKKWDKEKLKKILKIEKENSIIDYLSISIDNNLKLSYITRDRLERFEDNFFNDKLRQKFAYMGKVGKVMNKLVKDTNIKITTSDVEKIQALLKGEINDVFEIVSGEDIKFYYSEDNYCDCNNNGSLDNSCMKYNSCSDYFDLYVENTKMLILKCVKCNDIIGRAIIWKNAINLNNNEKINFIDRIYGTNQTQEMFKIWAKKHNYLWKLKQNFDNDTLTDGENEYKIPIKFNINDTCDFYPYMDTMKYISFNGEYLLNEQGSFKYSYDTILNCTEGNNQNRSCCEYCEEYLDQDTMYCVESIGYVCENCLHDNCVYIEYYCEYFDLSDDDIFLCSNCKEYHHKNEFYIMSDGEYICSNCNENYIYCEDVDDYQHIDNTFYCETCGCDFSNESYGNYNEILGHDQCVNCWSEEEEGE